MNHFAGMAGEEGSSGEASPSEAIEVTEEYANVTVERHVPRVNCPEHIVSTVAMNKIKY